MLQNFEKLLLNCPREKRRGIRKNLQSVRQALYIVRMERYKRKLQRRDVEKKSFTGADGMTL